jgi:lysophospholipase L1-like esterase
MPVYIHTMDGIYYRSSLNPIIAYELKPLVRGHNADGIRADRDYSTRKPDGVFRIVVVGDSLAYGLKVYNAQTYSKRLEDLLNGRSGNTVRYEVINLGVPGYRISQIVERLRTKGVAYHPDLVIYGLWLDDITDSCNLHEKNLVSAAQEGGENGDRLVLTDDINRHNLRNFILRFQIARRIIMFYRGLKQEQLEKQTAFQSEAKVDEVLKENLPEETLQVYLAFRDKVNHGRLEDLRGFEPYYRNFANPKKFLEWHRYLKAFSDLAKKENFRTLLLMTPVIYNYRPGEYNWQELHELIEKVAAVQGIPTVDVLAEFGRRRAAEIGTGDAEHPNARGHAIIAKKLYTYLVEQGLAAP